MFELLPQLKYLDGYDKDDEEAEEDEDEEDGLNGNSIYILKREATNWHLTIFTLLIAINRQGIED